LELEFFFIYPVKQEDVRIGIEPNLEELQHLFKSGERKTLDEGVPGAYHRCLFYTDEFSLPFDDLYDVESQKLPLGGDPTKESFVYPFPIGFRKEMGNFFRPPITDLEWMEVGARALARFTEDYRQNKLTTEEGSESEIIKKVDYKVPLYNRHTNVAVTMVSSKSTDTVKHIFNEVYVEDQTHIILEPSKEGSDHDPNACRVCKRADQPLKLCGRCKKKLYCSRECQQKDWSIHSKICTPKEKDEKK